MKNKLILIIFNLIIFANFNTSLADDSAIDDLFNPENGPLASPVQSSQGLENCPSEADILDLITCSNNPEDVPLINAPRILQENLYKHTTNPVTIRSLLDEPTLMPNYLSSCEWSFSAQFFLNYCPHVFFTEDSPFIKDYVDLTNKNIISEISNKEFINANVPEILGLFHNIKLNQYRVGLMFNLSRQWDNFAFDFRIPLYYLLEHFFLTNAEINKIKNSPFIAQLQLTPSAVTSCDVNEAKEMEFALQHLVSDKIGLGDSRLNLVYKFHCTPHSEFWLGARLTFPTAINFKAGLLGGEFTKCTSVPPFNIKHLFDLYTCPIPGTTEAKLSMAELSKEVQDILVGALDRLSAMVINAPLGNRHHFGVGPEINYRYQFNDYFSMHTYAAVEFFNKDKEHRFFLAAKNPKSFVRNYRDPKNAVKNLAFLNRQAINTLFPKKVSIEIQPGIIAQFNQSFIYNSSHWNAFIGFDYWHQGREKIGCLVEDHPVGPLQIEKGIRPPAHQGKIYLGFGYNGKTRIRDLDWYVSFKADGTVFNKGIGETFTLGITLGIDF